MQTDPNSRWQDRSSFLFLANLRQDFLSRAYSVRAIISVRKRSAKDRHKPVAEELVNDAVIAINDLDHELKQRFEIRYYFFRTPLFCEAGKVPNIQKHHTYVFVFTSQVGFSIKQCFHDSR